MKKLHNLAIILFISILASTATTTMAQQGTWERLGTRRVDRKLDHDEIIVTWREGKFDAIKIEVKGAALNMHKCVVHFENGGEQDLLLKHNFSQGSDSRIIDLKGNNRFIERISFWYDTKGLLRGKAIVTVWGRH
jgi:hypothetical protein